MPSITKHNTYRAVVYYKKNRYYIGTFKTIDEARKKEEEWKIKNIKDYRSVKGLKNKVRKRKFYTVIECHGLGRSFDVLVDNDSYEKRLKHLNTTISINFRRGKYYANCRVDNKLVQLHRYLTNFPKNQYIDFINGVTLDVRLLNLRIGNKSISRNNIWNKRFQSTSPYTNVFKRNDGRGWRARIRRKNETFLDKTVSTEEEALQLVHDWRMKTEWHYFESYNFVSTDIVSKEYFRRKKLGLDLFSGW